jgi:N-acetylneuraminate synthase
MLYLLKNIKMTKIIAEIGINHNGDIELAKKLISMAKICGCDYVKFQKRNPEICVPEEQKKIMRETPWGYISYLDYKKKIEFSKKDYIEIDNFCKEIKIEWFASAWDFDSLYFLEQFNNKNHKIASALITNIDFLKQVALLKKYTFISTGMCELKDIDNAVNIFIKANCQFELMHSVSTYPADEKDLNLSLINFYKERYNCKVGYSGHEDTISPSILAAALGASSIERHITLNRSLFGTDQSASVEERGLRELVTVVKKIPMVLGVPQKKILEAEKLVAQKMRYWERNF